MFLIPLGNDVFAEVDEVDLLPALLHCSWCLNSKGYASSGNDFLHWFIARRMGLIWTETIDHKDRNKLNCKRENLRIATRSEQMVNREIQSNNTTSHKCISWRNKRWVVRVQRNNKLIYIGSFKTIEEALRQRDTYLLRNNMELL